MTTKTPVLLNTVMFKLLPEILSAKVKKRMVCGAYLGCRRNSASSAQNPAGNIPLIGGITGGIGKLFG